MKHLVFALVLYAMPCALSAQGVAQESGKIHRIGFLIAPTPSFFLARLEGFRQGLKDLGYVEGKNIAIEARYADGRPDRLGPLAAELVGLDVSVIVASGPGGLAAKKATRTIPIVFVAVQDPVATGLVESLALPGGNVTGLSTLAPELGGKRLEILKGAFPKISHVAFIRGTALTAKDTEAAAQALGVRLQSLEVRNSKDLDSAFNSAIKERAQGLLTSAGSLFNAHQDRIVEFAATHRLPAMYASPEFIDVGGLMSYAPSYPAIFRRAAYYIDKILRGAKPGDLPVEQPTKFELVINLKTAKQIGLAIPPHVLARADKVIR
jgi:putative tryptophan/tyrosine transport system substrate-binding protein